MLSAIVMFVASVCSFYSMPANSVGTERIYKKFNAKTGASLGSYSLTVEHGEQPSPRVVIDNDERELDWSKRGVVKIITADGSFGTGFVVGRHTIATAAHVLTTTNGESLQGAEISCLRFFNSDGSVSRVIYPTEADLQTTNQASDIVWNTYMECHVPKSYIDAKGTYPYDYALITVSVDLRKYQCFNLGYVMDSTIFDALTVSEYHDDNNQYPNKKRISVFVTGFPAMVNGNSVNSVINHHMFTGEGIILNNPSADSTLLYFSTDTSNGNSGGPVYICEEIRGEKFYTVIGLIDTGNDCPPNTYNCGVKFTPDVLKFYAGNPNTL